MSGLPDGFRNDETGSGELNEVMIKCRPPHGLEHVPALLSLSEDEFSRAFEYPMPKRKQIKADPCKHSRKSHDGRPPRKISKANLCRERNWSNTDSAVMKNLQRERQRERTTREIYSMPPDHVFMGNQKKKKKKNAVLGPKHMRHGTKKQVPPLGQGVREKTSLEATRCTFETADSVATSYESILRKNALEHVLVREGVLENLRTQLRPHDTCAGKSAMERQRKREKLSLLLQDLKDITLKAIQSIAKWQCAFVAPREFPFVGDGGVQVCYLSCISRDTAFLDNHPVAVHILEQLNCALGDKGNARFQGSPLLRNVHASQHSGADALSHLSKHLEHFQSQNLDDLLCSWCGCIPKQPKAYGSALVRCSNRTFCKGSKYCKCCILANCLGGLKEYKTILHAASWTCFLCKNEGMKKARKHHRRDARARGKQRGPFKSQAHTREKRMSLFETMLHQQKHLKRRRLARRWLASRGNRAKTILGMHLKAKSALCQFADQVRRQHVRRAIAFRWLRHAGEAATEERRHANNSGTSSVVLLELEHAKERGNQFRGTQVALQDDLVRETTQAESRVRSRRPRKPRKAQAPINIRTVLRVLSTEFFLVRLVSAARRLELVEARMFVPSKQVMLGPWLMHIDEVSLDRKTLLQKLRSKVHPKVQSWAYSELLRGVRRARPQFQHRQQQAAASRQLADCASLALKHRKRQVASRTHLLRRAFGLREHLQRRGAAIAFFSGLVGSLRRHRQLQASVHHELCRESRRAQLHVAAQKEAAFHLTAKSKHLQSVIRAQRHARMQLCREAERAAQQAEA